MAECGGCEREIVWGTTARGKSVPLDPPEKRYVQRTTSLVGHGRDDSAFVMVDTFMPHHATCPNVEDFR